MNMEIPMIELPNEIDDSLTLELVRAQLPRGLAVEFRRAAMFTLNRWLVYAAPCLRSPIAMVTKGGAFRARVIVPSPSTRCDLCNRPMHEHPMPEHMEILERQSTVYIADKDNHFTLRY